MRAHTKKKHGMGKRFAIVIGVAAVGVMALGAQTGAQTPAPTPPGQALPNCGSGDNHPPVTIVGTEGSDQITGTAAADVIAALGGKDTITGRAGNDTICGGSGNDTLMGGPGRDSLLGQKGKDTLNGGAGKDWCKGGGVGRSHAKDNDTASGCEL